MICRKCDQDARDQVTHSTPAVNGLAVRRYRKCKCGNRWTTLELPTDVIDALLVDDGTSRYIELLRDATCIK